MEKKNYRDIFPCEQNFKKKKFKKKGVNYAKPIMKWNGEKKKMISMCGLHGNVLSYVMNFVYDFKLYHEPAGSYNLKFPMYP